MVCKVVKFSFKFIFFFGKFWYGKYGTFWPFHGATSKWLPFTYTWACLNHNKIEDKGATKKIYIETTNEVYATKYIGGYVQPSLWAV